MTAVRPAAEPAGGTTTPSSAGRSGPFCFPEETGGDRPPSQPTARISQRHSRHAARVPAGGGRAAHLPALAAMRTCSRRTARAVAPTGRKKPFVITQPPPNITGALHIGHALTATVEDAMIRRARMQGYPTLWVPGVDHASIAAQVVLDRMLAKDGETRESLGRERYLERMWQFINETRTVIGDQHKRLGASVDWSRLRFTMDEGSGRGGARRIQAAVRRRPRLSRRAADQLVSGLTGRACPTSRSSPRRPRARCGACATTSCATTASVDPDDTITVATTRPETILGDTAVAVHPEDARYTGAVGRQVLIPFVNRVVPVIADDVVRREFGTGAVKITPAHDARRLRDGQAPRPADDRRDDRRRPHQRQRRRIRRPDAGRRRASASSPTSRARRPRRPSSRTTWSSAAASAAATSSSRASRRSGSSTSSRWRTRPWPRSARAGRRSSRRAIARCSSTGWRTSTTGTSAASCGGATAFRRGTAPTAT